MSNAYEDGHLHEPPPEHTKTMRVDVIGYEATDPQTPEALRGLARAVVNGRLDNTMATAPTAEEAAAKLRSFYEEEIVRLGGMKKRGRKPKTISGPVGSPDVSLEDEEII